MTQLNNLRALLVNQSSSSSSGSTASLIGGVTSSTTAAASSFISTSSSINGIVKTEPTTIPTNSIKIEPDCKFTKYYHAKLLYSKFYMIVLIYDTIYNSRFFFQAWMPFCLLGWIQISIYQIPRFQARAIQPPFFMKRKKNNVCEISWISMSSVLKVNFTY